MQLGILKSPKNRMEREQESCSNGLRYIVLKESWLNCVVVVRRVKCGSTHYKRAQCMMIYEIRIVYNGGLMLVNESPQVQTQVRYKCLNIFWDPE